MIQWEGQWPKPSDSTRNLFLVPARFYSLLIHPAHPLSDPSAFKAMKYFSTRGSSERLSFEDVRPLSYISFGYPSIDFGLSAQTVLAGLAPNGGLYIPEHIPSLPSDWQEKWKSLSFVGLTVEVLSLYISEDEVSRDDLRKLAERSYATFRHPDITPLQRLNEKLFVLELFHGPTFAFKDVALQLLGNLFEYFLARRNSRKSSEELREKLTVLGATSGDTGRYAMYFVVETRSPTALSVRRFMVFETRRMSQFSSSTRKDVCPLFSRLR